MTDSTRRPRARRHVADLLSLGNLCLGVVAMVWALQAHYVLCLFAVAVGAVFDGLDGAAARRWGGTALGVLADDVADAVTYGVAPAVAVWSFLGGVEGVALGAAYALFTFTRLLHFTLSKSHADPLYFHGTPSTVGGLMVLCSLIAFREHPLLVAVAVGAVSVELVAFSARYRHAGRWFAALATPHKAWVAAAVLAVAGSIACAPGTTACALFFAAAVYVLWPNLRDLGQGIVAATQG